MNNKDIKPVRLKIDITVLFSLFDHEFCIGLHVALQVDRSVTGLVAQQQCVGPLHTPLADVAVTAFSYFSTVCIFPQVYICHLEETRVE